jgi:hypothetical protein
METDHKLLVEWLKGDARAIALCQSLLYIAHVWDDLIDDDPTPPESINNAFCAALITIPRNSFFQENRFALQPEIDRAITNWLDANILEKEGNLAASYGLRNDFDAIIIKCAEIVGGWEWSRAVSIAVRREMYSDFNDYQKEHS